MPKNSALLTIAIPTYNRSHELETLLKKILSQKSKEIIILVSDDNSADNTEEMVKKYQKKYTNIMYNKNKPNYGFSHNVCTLYELSKTPYIWFLCDDDVVVPNAINNVVATIKKYQPTVAIFNYTWINPYGNKVTAGPLRGDLLHTDRTEIKNYQPLMRLTFLSNLVMKKGPALTPLKKTDYKNNIFFQLTLGLFLLDKNFSLLESSRVILHRNVGYKYGEFFKSYMTDHLDAIFALRTGFSRELFLEWSKKQLFTALSLYLSQKLGLFSFLGRPSQKTYSKLKEYYGNAFVFIKLFEYIKMVTPTFALKAAYFAVLIAKLDWQKALKIYQKNIDRASHDARTSGFLLNK